MDNNLSSISSVPSWENIKETALQNQNLNADVRVSDKAVQVNAPSMWQRFKVAMRFEKAPVYASREETLTNLREQFGLDFSKKLRSLIQETGIKTDSEEYKTLVTHAMQSFEVITQKLTTAIATPTVSTSQAIQEAHEGALNSLALFRKKFAKPQMTPQFCVTAEGQISVLLPAPHPENAALSGGGVKGAGYVGWFKAAEKFGFLKNLKRIAGSSAGAITAALIASGMNAEDFERASNRTNLWSLLTGTSQNSVINAATKLETKGWLSYIGFSGTYAVDHINQEMVGSIRKYFSAFKTENEFRKKIEERQKEKGNNISDDDKQRLCELYQKIVSPSSRGFFDSWFQKKPSTYMVTFQDLALLTKSDSRFKELTVTGYDLNRKKEKYFNAQTAPNLGVAEAVRGSIGIPIAFDPVFINDDKIIDGGVGSNTPAEVFKDCSSEKTVVLEFEDDGRFKRIVYGTKKDQQTESIIARGEERLEEAITGNPHLQQAFQADDKKAYKAGPNAMMVGEGNLEIASFTATPEQIHQAQRQAEIRAMEAFSLRQNQAELKSIDQVVSGLEEQRHAVDALFASLKDAMGTMTLSELESIALYYVSKPSDGNNVLSEKDRLAISKAAQDELATRVQREFALT